MAPPSLGLAPAALGLAPQALWLGRGRAPPLLAPPVLVISAEGAGTAFATPAHSGLMRIVIRPGSIGDARFDSADVDRECRARAAAGVCLFLRGVAGKGCCDRQDR